MSAHDLPQVALIGVTGYARAYLEWAEAAVAQSLIQLVAVVVINREQEEAACARLEAQGVLIYKSWAAMLETWHGRLDLCLAPVPIHLHAEIAIAALEAGANVLIEKPLAATVEQARSICAAERRTGRWVAVGYQDCYSDSTREISSDLAAGRIGRVRSIRWLGLWPRPEAYYRRNQWAGRISVGGQPVRDSPLNNAMAHHLNLALHWAGAGSGRAPEPIRMEAELYRSYPIESFDTAVMRLRTSAGVTIHASVSHCCAVERPIFMRILGDEGELQWTHQQKAIWFYDGVETGSLPLAGRVETMESMFSTVLARLSSSQASICTSEQALLHVRVIEALPSEIRSIEPPFSALITKNGESRMIVEDIATDLAACMNREAMPTEVGVAWAGSATLIEA